MRVALIASTQFPDVGALSSEFTRPPGVADADLLAEGAGRNCYRSFNRPNPKTATNQGYLDHIIEIAHESVLEHATATFYIEASRSVLAELTRHRHLSFSVVSQRYVDANKLGFHMPPAVNVLPRPDRDLAASIIVKANAAARESYNELVEIFVRNGLARKQGREAARCVLPGGTSSPMVVSGNHRAWRYVLKNRWHAAADAEIRELAGLLLAELRQIAPNTYQDIPSEPYGS